MADSRVSSILEWYCYQIYIGIERCYHLGVIGNCKTGEKYMAIRLKRQMTLELLVI